MRAARPDVDRVERLARGHEQAVASRAAEADVGADLGQRIGQIRLPEICANVCFGGTRRNRLFMTASQSLYAVFVEARGAHFC